MEKRIIIAGSGGQGILFIGKLIAHSAMLEGKEVTWFPSYGAEMRGGTANCTVIVSDEIIGSPITRNPDILIVMNKSSYDRFFEKVISGGILLYDSSLINSVSKREDIYVIGVPASEIAAKKNFTSLANMVIVGAFSSTTNLISLDSILKSIEDIVSSHRRELININKELIREGYELYEKNKKSQNVRY
jgi:2-oxoglutarate ferredoxin oxidoreductase subunit gamma